MATGYQGYTGYDEDSVKRQRAMADALMQRTQQPRQIEHWTQGVSQLAEALLARQAIDKADTSEKAYKSSQQQIADALIGDAFPDAQTSSATELAAPAAYDLTPKAAENRAGTASLGGQVKMMAKLTGNPMQAMQYGQGVMATRQANDRYRDETQYARGRDVRGDFVADRAYDFGAERALKGDEQWKAGFDQTGQQFDATMGHNRNILGETTRHNKATEGIDAIEAANKAAAAGTKPTPMQTAVDKNWADDLVNWQINGAANFGKQMTQLTGAVQRLKGGEELSGPGTTALVGPLRDWFGQSGKDVQQQIQEVIQSSLREVLGAQFTQKEGEGIMARTFDPTLEEGVNAQRAERLIAQLQLAAEQKNKALEYYNANGTMNGYQGRVPSVSDFVAAIDSAPAGANYVVAPNGQQFSREQAASVRSFMSELPPSLQDPNFIAQLDKALGGNEPAKPSIEDLKNKWLK